MIGNELIEKLKNRIEEIDVVKEKTELAQIKLINESNEFNDFIKEFNNTNQFQKNSYRESYIKIQNINTRIQEGNLNISKIKDKLKQIKIKLNKNNININSDNNYNIINDNNDKEIK
jgi:hypothetical protein